MGYRGYQRALLACIVMTVGSAASASARDELGFKVGPGKIHLGAELYFGHLFNPGYFPDAQTSPGGEYVQALYLAARPKASYQMAGRMLELSVGGHAQYAGYLGINSSEAVNISTGRFSDLSGGGDLKLAVNPKGKFTFKFSESYRRRSNPGVQAGGRRLIVNTNEVGVSFIAKPGGGALVFDVGYAFYFDLYERNGVDGEPSAISDPDGARRFRHRPYLRIDWKFFPKTTAFFQAEADIADLADSFNVLGVATQPTDTYALLLYLGAQGQLTEKLKLQVKVGYGDTLVLTGGDNFRSVVGALDVNWAPFTLTKFGLGLSRRPESITIYNFADTTKVNLSYDQGIGKKFSIGTYLTYRYLDYGTPNADILAIFGGEDDRIDHVFGVKVSASYSALPWLTFTLSDSIDIRDSNSTLTTNAATGQVVPGSFVTNRVMLVADIFY